MAHTGFRDDLLDRRRLGVCDPVTSALRVEGQDYGQCERRALPVKLGPNEWAMWDTPPSVRGHSPRSPRDTGVRGVVSTPPGRRAGDRPPYV